MTGSPSFSLVVVQLGLTLLTLCGALIGVAYQSSAAERQRRSSTAIKIAEMRQAWIEHLRDAFAELAAHQVSDNKETRLIRDRNIQLNRILLMMNPRDRNFNKLNVVMMKLVKDDRPDDDLSDIWGEYIYICQIILKEEWDRLQRDLKLAADSDGYDPPLWFRDWRT